MTINLNLIGTYATGQFDKGAAEIPAFDPSTNRLFVVNAQSVTVDVLDLSDPSNPVKIGEIDASALGGVANSVAVKNGIVAIALEANVKTDNGSVVFFNSNSDFSIPVAPVNTVTVGALPDMVTFTPDGMKVLTANEGEPNDDYSVDPEGSISIIDLSAGIENVSVTTANFNAFDSQKDDLIARGVRIFGPNASVSQDLEPEYITFSSDSQTAYVTLQENNALAVVDVNTGTVSGIVPLGFKNHSQPENSLDVSNRDGFINIDTWPVFGMYQPDAIASYEVNGQTYIVSANEGDSRNYAGFSEEARVKNLTLDPVAFPNAGRLQEDEQLGRLNVTSTLGDTDGDGDFDQLYSYGARSFSIWDSNGNLVFDSGNQFEQIVAQQIPDYFNSNNDDNDSFDSRSDDKGPEPEGVTVGEINGVPYAFIGLERVGGVMVYDIRNPENPQFVQYLNNRDFTVDAQLEDGSSNPEAGDLGPEGLTFISAEDSPNGIPLLVVANEVSGSTSVYEINGRFTPPNQPAQMVGLGDFETDPVFTIGQIFEGSQGYYVPPGILDGLGAFALDEDTIRVLANHELSSEVGYAYTLANGTQLTGGRVSFFDINKETRELEDAGLAYDTIINRAGEVVDEASDLEFMGLNRLCSAQYIEANQFGNNRGLVDGLFFTGEETGGGTEFVLDPATNTLYAVPWMGRAAWENVTQLDTGTTNKVALLIGDDRGGAPLLLYVGEKGQGEGPDVLVRNGLAQGKLYVWVADSGETTPEEFNGTFSGRSGSFVEIDYYQHLEILEDRVVITQEELEFRLDEGYHHH